MTDAIAQMNWGRMRWPPNDLRLGPFIESLETVYAEAANHPGFIWRIPDTEMAAQAMEAGFDNRISATVSVWQSIEALRDYTFNSSHGRWMARRSEWFEVVDGPQLVIWPVKAHSRPSLREALERLHHLKTNGPTIRAGSWQA